MGYFSNQLAHSTHAARPEIQWDETSCLLCDSVRHRVLLEAADDHPGGTQLRFAVVQCANCGFCFTNPRPDVESMAQFYAHDYLPHAAGATKPAPRTLWRPLLDLLRGNYRRHLPVRGGGRLLDFGCGGGSFLQRMRADGWQVTGVDVAAAAIEQLRSEAGLHAVVGSLPHADLEPASYDMVTMWESLEHVHNPLEVLRAAHDLLVPGGELLVATPNIDSLAFRWFGQAWWGLDLPRHLSHFTPWTLQLMLNRAGFRTGRVRMIRHSSWLRRSAARRLRHENDRRSRWLARRWPASIAASLACLLGRADCMLTVAVKPHAP